MIDQPTPETAATWYIHWMDGVGTSGNGTKRFTRADALSLADALNEEYPHITHEARDATTQPPQ